MNIYSNQNQTFIAYYLKNCDKVVYKIKHGQATLLQHKMKWLSAVLIYFTSQFSYNLSKQCLSTLFVLSGNLFHSVRLKQTNGMLVKINAKVNDCDQICEKRSYNLSHCTYLAIHNFTCEYGTNLKFGHFTLLT